MKFNGDHLHLVLKLDCVIKDTKYYRYFNLATSCKVVLLLRALELLKSHKYDGDHIQRRRLFCKQRMSRKRLTSVRYL